MLRQVRYAMLVTSGFAVTCAQSRKLTSRAIPPLCRSIGYWNLNPLRKPRLVKGHSACVIPGICARLRTTLSNYDSAEEAEGLEWAQAEKMTAKLDGARQMEVAVDCARRGDYFGPLDSLPTAR